MLLELKREASPPFSVAVRSRAGVSTTGVLDYRTVDLFCAVVGGLIFPMVIVDVTGLTGIDTCGLAAISSEDDLRRARRGRLLVVGAPTWLRRAIVDAGCDRLLPAMTRPERAGVPGFEPGTSAV